MTYIELKEHIGQRVDIVNGTYVLTDDGNFVVSDIFGSERIWLTPDERVQCITSQPFIGREYSLGKVDCVSLVCEFLDDELSKFYQGLSMKELFKLQRKTVIVWLKDNESFTDVGTDIQPGDCVVYDHSDQMLGNHIGIIKAEGKILHHLPHKLACIDVMEPERIMGVYRYANR
jgi:hypothetical protein